MAKASKTSSGAVQKSTLYKVGDYLTANDRVFIKIIAVIDSGMGPMYGVLTPKHSDHIHWKSQYELDSDNLYRSEPDFAGFKQLKAGDILRIGQDEKSSTYVTVLARVDDAVLLSSTPDKRLAERLLKLDKFMKEATEEIGVELTDFLDEKDLRDFKRVGSQLHASKIVGDWQPVETLALMHWDIIKE